MDPHQYLPASLTDAIQSLWKNSHLVWLMTKRDILGRYQNSLMGIAWSFITPLLMLTVYSFVFSVAFPVRWNNTSEYGPAYFPVILFSGLIVHGFFSECINKAPGLITANTNFVKKVVFPLEILPWVTIGSALFHTGVSTLVLLGAVILITQQLHWTIVFLPIVLLPLILATAGLTWLFAALGVFVRDIKQVAEIASTAMLFISPIFYPATAIPEKYQFLIQLNPLAFIIESTRKTLLFGEMPNWSYWFLNLVIGLLIAQSGYWWFQRTRKGFADVL